MSVLARSLVAVLLIPPPAVTGDPLARLGRAVRGLRGSGPRLSDSLEDPQQILT